mgnify:CR=1 FL=1
MESVDVVGEIVDGMELHSVASKSLKEVIKSAIAGLRVIFVLSYCISNKEDRLIKFEKVLLISII